ncbi:MAG TPA: flagellar biosynthesis protein FlhA [Burkholderiaceae bacterium]|jgi:flagellar biosynthesis protein FlhA
MNGLERFFGRQTDVALVALVMGVMVVLFAPIPAALLDFLILANFSFAFLILLLTFYMPKPVEFSTFPSLLLIATLFRLSLNVAATRLILSEAGAGKVIAAIGAHVVGGNYVIGLIVFFILIVVQYVVVTSGAQRVSEVAARFTLDSMPGQQMSIDADLNMGFIDQVEAQRRRKTLEKEAGFYGAMDGASKFVKGDAIAGIVILLINIVGGMIIGVMQLGMPWSQALQTYTLLTIGDGIVTQVPALVIAVGTGIIVTRSASDTDLSREVFRQISSHPKTLVLVALTLGCLILLPGIPVLPATTLCAVVLGAAWISARAKRRAANPAASGSTSGTPDANVEANTDPYADLKLEPIELRVGARWAPLAKQADGMFMDRVATFRRQHALEFGLVVPNVTVKEGLRRGPEHYEIHIDGVPVARGEAHVDKLLAIHPAGDVKAVQGVVTKDPSYGLPAVWIEPQQRDAAIAARYTLVDAETVMLTHLTEVLRRESATLLTRAETELMLGRVRQAQPSLVEELIPTLLSVSEIQRVLQALLKEKVSIRNLEAILETLSESTRVSKDPGYLTERVRQRLGPAICQSLLGEASALQVLTLDPLIEGQLVMSVRGMETGSHQGLDPKLTEQMLGKLAHAADRMMKSNALPVLLCSPELRRQIRAMSERVLPHLRVLSMTEVPNSVELKSFAVVAL